MQDDTQKKKQEQEEKVKKAFGRQAERIAKITNFLVMQDEFNNAQIEWAKYPQQYLLEKVIENLQKRV